MFRIDLAALCAAACLLAPLAARAQTLPPEIAAHIQWLIDSGEWTPRRERLPYWTAPVPQVARPKA